MGLGERWGMRGGGEVMGSGTRGVNTAGQRKRKRESGLTRSQKKKEALAVKLHALASATEAHSRVRVRGQAVHPRGRVPPAYPSPAQGQTRCGAEEDTQREPPPQHFVQLSSIVVTQRAIMCLRARRQVSRYGDKNKQKRGNTERERKREKRSRVGECTRVACVSGCNRAPSAATTDR